MIKMIALDLDETLLNTDKTISEENVATLQRLHQAGMKVVLCTGRPINAIWGYIKQLGLTTPGDFTITFNGALVVNNVTKETLAQSGLKHRDFELLHAFASANGYPLDILDFEQVYPIADLKPSVYQQMLKAPMAFTPTNFADLPDHLYSKAVMATDAAVLDQVVATLTPDLKQQYHVVRSQPKILEFLAADMDKAVGLGQLLTHFGWNFSNLMAFGDAENDLGMIKAAGDGVAMLNGQPEVKAAANHQTPTENNAAGVATYLQQVFEDAIN
ncbi:Cof-type HAD-IIB family hydrolase [Levilactobacillus acidifarinae]|uniref:HAD superfamily hydrolase n=1 Tax=Levilactobacillus acidifarinae DSM 19394 = JCM 15949 TaxID=1423715 RepID=A0A0R1LMI0_9LACO|nr:Cof-type HAD-IIB family hydrolase [Levilactobacillus acidifarinae]KRK93969.1 HAD superfamily hydrolase [Levilactobacillus acidifarinae DSM 19394]GEO68857.1 haloacid dehalogenase [Levilactobacillus acidifarinae]